MAGSRFLWPNPFSVNADGTPRVGAKLAFYATGTDTPQNTYADAALTVPNPNPIISDSLGQFGAIFMLLSPQYKVVLADANDVEIWTEDPCGAVVEISGGVPVGAMMPYGGASPPTGWQFCSGAEISRTVFAELFGVIGTRYGIGDGSTTFNLPDKRGRVSAGRDDMGGGAAGRLTFGVSGVDGLTVGAAGGDQNAQTDTLNANSTAVSSVTDPEHAHGMTGFLGIVGAGFVWGSGGSGYSFGNSFTQPALTGISVATTVTTTVASLLIGQSQNVQPTEVDNWIVFCNA